MLTSEVVNEAGQTIQMLGYKGNALCTMVAILVAVVIYAVLVVVLRAITKEDLSLMPKGDKIARLLHLS